MIDDNTDKLELVLAEATKDYARARAAVATLIELNHLCRSGDRLKSLAQAKLNALPAHESSFYGRRRSLRAKLQRGELNYEEALAALTTWRADIARLRETSARVLRLLPVFKEDHTASQTESGHPCNKLTNTNRLLSDQIPLPSVVALDSSNRCNLRCVTCPQAHDQKFPPFDLAWLDAGKFEKALTSAEAVHVAGSGEPLLSPTCLRLLTTAAAAGAHVSMTTNASLLNRVLIPEDISDRITIGVSFDGGTRETVQTIRRGFDWDRITTNLRELPETTRKRVTLAMTIVRQNHHELPQLADLARELGIFTIQLQQFTAWTATIEEMRLSRAEWERLQEDRHRLLGTHPDIAIQDFTHPPHEEPNRTLDFDASFKMIAEIRPQMFPQEPIEDAINDFEAAAIPRLDLEIDPVDRPPKPSIDDGDTVTIPHCTAAWSFASIWSEGCVLPCCSSMPPMGSVRDQTFEEIWNGDAYQELRASLAGEGEIPVGCRNCQDSSRFTRIVEIAQGVLSDRPSARLRLLFSLDELPDHLRSLWDSKIPPDRVLNRPLSDYLA